MALPLPRPWSRGAQMPYLAVRLSWSWAALKAWARRWGVRVALLLGIAGGLAGSLPSAVGTTLGLMAWSVMPLVQARDHGLWSTLGMTAIHSLGGALLVGMLRPLLWQDGWREFERALPLPLSARRRADLVLVVLALLPLAALYVAGLVVWFTASPHGASDALALAPWIALSLGLSVLWGMAVMHWSRRPAHLLITTLRWARWQPQRPQGARLWAARRPGSPGAAVSSFQALAWHALWHPPAMGRAAVAAILALACGALLLGLSAAPAPWVLALLSAGGLLATSRLRALAETHLAPLHDQCGHLPLDTATLRRQRQYLAATPALVGLGLLQAGLLAGAHSVRMPVSLAYTLVWVVANVLLARPVADPAAKGPDDGSDSVPRACLWLLALCLLIALGSEATA